MRIALELLVGITCLCLDIQRQLRQPSAER